MLTLTVPVRRSVILSSIIAASALVAALVVPTSASAATSPYGNDVSYPQCASAGSASAGTLPAAPAFGVVGVNNGLPNATNPCLAAQLAWAAKAPGAPALYVNTANPGKLASWWPTANRTQHGAKAVKNPYGTCSAKHYDAACSFVYGYSMAYDDVTARGVAHASRYTWWLDVETANTWSTSTAANRADLEGMRAYFSSITTKVGVYATRAHWKQITGTVPAKSSLTTLPSWVALGRVSAASALSACAGSSLTATGRLTLTQFVSGTTDVDVACRTFAKAATPTIHGTLRAGHRLSVAHGVWSPSPSYRYQWFRGTTPIAHATHATYTLTSRDKGHTISVKVTGLKSGYSKTVKASTSKRIAR